MPPEHIQDARRAARSEAAKRGAETRRRNVAARKLQQQPKPAIFDLKYKTSSNTNSFSTQLLQVVQSAIQTKAQLLAKAGCKFALDHKAVIVAFVAGMIFSYLLSGSSDETKIILEMIKFQKLIFDKMAVGAGDSSGFVAVVRNAAQVVSVGMGGHLLGIAWKPLVKLGLIWYFGGT